MWVGYYPASILALWSSSSRVEMHAVECIVHARKECVSVEHEPAATRPVDCSKKSSYHAIGLVVVRSSSFVVHRCVQSPSFQCLLFVAMLGFVSFSAALALRYVEGKSSAFVEFGVFPR